LGLYLVI